MTSGGWTSAGHPARGRRMRLPNDGRVERIRLECGIRPVLRAFSCWVPFLGLFLLSTPCRALEPAPPRMPEPVHGAPSTQAITIDYDIDTEIAPDLRALHGRARIHIDSARRFRCLLLLDHTRRLNPDPFSLPDYEVPRIFPGGGGAGSMTMRALPDGDAMDIRRESGDEIVMLCGASRRRHRLDIEYELEIPKRYGDFGVAKGRLTLAGGWYPMIVGLAGLDADEPRRVRVGSSSMRLRLRMPSGHRAMLDGRELEGIEGEDGTWVRGQGVAGIHLLALGPFRAFRHRGIRYLSPSRSRRDWRLVKGIIDRTLETWTRAGGPPVEHPPAIIRFPSRDRLVEVQEGTLLMSDQALRVFPFFLPVHERAVARGMLTLFLREAMHCRGRDTDCTWMIPLFTEVLTARYRREHRRELSLIRLLEPLSFIPSVDASLRAPKVAFVSDVYERRGAERGGTSTFAGEVSGRKVDGPSLLRALDRRCGPEAVRAAVEETMKAPSADGFLEALEERCPVSRHEIPAFVKQAEDALRPVDRRLRNVRMRWDGSRWHTTFDLEQEPAPDRLSSIPIDVHTKDENRRLEWDGRPRRMDVVTAQRVRHIEVDPEREGVERAARGHGTRDDNEWPRPLKPLLSLHPLSADVAARDFQGVLTFYLTRPETRRWLLTLNAYTLSGIPWGLEAGGHLYFGAYRDALYRRQRVGIHLVEARHARGTPWSGQAENVVDTLGARVSWRFENRSSVVDALRGWSARVMFETGRGWARDLKGDPSGAPYWTAGARVAGNWAPHPRHGFAGRLSLDGLRGLGSLSGNPSTLFPLGGANRLRALPADQIRGSLRWLASFEYRLTLVRALNLHLWSMRLDGFQAIAFMDFGAVGATTDTLIRDARSGYGVGIAAFVDQAGIWPGFTRLDLALPADGWSSPRLLIQFSQPF